MRINPIQVNYNNYNSQKKQSFKGYDARPVKALVCRRFSSPKLTEEVREQGKNNPNDDSRILVDRHRTPTLPKDY